MWIGPQHLVKDLIEYVSSVLSKSDTFDGDCECKGLTSTWALEDGGLVFCENDSIFELDGWDSTMKKIQLVAVTDHNPIEHWTEAGAIPKDDEGFTVMELKEYKWGKH